MIPQLNPLDERFDAAGLKDRLVQQRRVEALGRVMLCLEKLDTTFLVALADNLEERDAGTEESPALKLVTK